ncbi:MAG: hypothetical protein GY906_21395 [bacterium]|nr:hypothetical protein [bacterium]
MSRDHLAFGDTNGPPKNLPLGGTCPGFAGFEVQHLCNDGILSVLKTTSLAMHGKRLRRIYPSSALLSLPLNLILNPLHRLSAIFDDDGDAQRIRSYPSVSYDAWGL